ncbi:hypothetical protein F183_A33510 [Bryobacterales bacterium F-183]|nr:hypothetical protein F183_A33510 [Bryobacterales bacterium F-183]
MDLTNSPISLTIEVLSIQAPPTMQHAYQWRAHAEAVAHAFGQQFAALVHASGLPAGFDPSRPLSLPPIDARPETAAATGRRLATALYASLTPSKGAR